MFGYVAAEGGDASWKTYLWIDWAGIVGEKVLRIISDIYWEFLYCCGLEDSFIYHVLIIFLSLCT